MALSSRSPRAGQTRRTQRPVRASAGAAPTIASLFQALDAIAPFHFAAEWDNVGLLAGDERWPLRRALLTLDLTDAVAEEALAGRHDAVIAYHPPIFKGIRAVTARADAPTRRLADLLAARIALLATHTALDAAPGGTNDVILDRFDLVERFPLQPHLEPAGHFKLVVFAPATEAARLRAALAEAGAGQIGAYDECSFELAGRGSFRGGEASHPTIGQRGRLEFVDELRLEMIVPRAAVGAAVRALHATHSYEEPAYDLYPLHLAAGRGQIGMGRVGRLAAPTKGPALLARLRGFTDLSCAATVGGLERTFNHVVAAAGAFGTRNYHDRDALIITGELKHHEALHLQREGFAAVCLGHWASERPALIRLAEALARRLPGIEFTAAQSDRAPFRALAPASSRPARATQNRPRR